MNRWVMPLAVPAGAIVIVAIIVIAISRVLLAFNKETTPVVALAIAMVVLLGCAALAARTNVEGA